MQTPICTTPYMQDSLKFFSKELVFAWFEKCKEIDAVLKNSIESNTDAFKENHNRITVSLKADFLKRLEEAGVEHDYNFSNFEAHNGYTVYALPDNGAICEQSEKPDLYYGLAKASSFGITHTHKLSDAFNYILDGEGVFAGNPEDQGKFDFHYHGQQMIAGCGYQIPIGMSHGHLVKEGKEIWFLFVQECGFASDKKCAGDFYIINDYDKSQFGPYYI